MTIYLMLLLGGCVANCPNPTWVNPGITLTDSHNTTSLSANTTMNINRISTCSCTQGDLKIAFTRNKAKAEGGLATGYRVFSIYVWLYGTFGEPTLKSEIKELIRQPRPQEFTLETNLIEVQP